MPLSSSLPTLAILLLGINARLAGVEAFDPLSHTAARYAPPRQVTGRGGGGMAPSPTASLCIAGSRRSRGSSLCTAMTDRLPVEPRGDPSKALEGDVQQQQVSGLLQASLLSSRRGAFAAAAGSLLAAASSLPASAAPAGQRGPLTAVADPSTYAALAYAPPGAQQGKKLPLIVVLHGAAINELDVWNLANPSGEHAGLAPSLLASNTAPHALSQNFAVIAPYSASKRSFYEEPRKKLLQFVEWTCSADGRAAGCPDADPARVFLFGFSDGATVGVELMTTGRFAGGVFAAYGFTGVLPSKAVDRLKGKPIWVFHSADDVIFPVSCSDRLVKTLRDADSTEGVVKYTRFDKDQEGFTGNVRGHSTGVTASKTAEVYDWLLQIRPK